MAFIDRLRSLFGGAESSGNDPGASGGSGADGTPCPEGGHGISCEDALQLVNEFIDGELEDVSSEEVRVHFEICVQCYPHLRLERCFKDALRRAAQCETAPPELRDKLLGVIAEARSEG